MKGLGYYAKCKATNNLLQMYWSEKNELFVCKENGVYKKVNDNDYEVLEVGYYSNE